jgi:hypothetical protein
VTSLEIVGDRLLVRLSGWSKVWALKGGLNIPLAHVRGAGFAPGGLKPKGLRAPGSYWPGVIAAGTYRWPGNKEFWSVRRLNKAIVLHLQKEGYNRLVLEVADPAATVAAINDAVARLAPASSV